MSYTFDADIVSDLHKEARGFRPREGFWSHWNLSTSDEKQAIWDALLREADIRFEEDKAREAAAVETFNATLELIQQTMDLDRDAALVRYVEGLGLDKYDLMYGGSYVCFHCGLPYEMQEQFDPAVKVVLAQLETVDELA
jgi:hypothetical protein